MNPELRDATSADHLELAGWLPDAYATLRWAGPRVVFPIVPRGLEYQLMLPESRSFVLIDGERLVAFGQRWQHENGAIHIDRILVDPAHRRKGHGKALCMSLIQQATQATGARAISLRVQRDNIPARNLFAGLGFQEALSESDSDTLFLRRMHRDTGFGG